eukprot:1984159-Pleurochrysis_carterae.AAC.1
MSTKQRKERRSPGTAVGRGVERDGDHGNCQMPIAQVVSVAYTKIGNALDALFGQSIRLQVIR